MGVRCSRGGECAPSPVNGARHVCLTSDALQGHVQRRVDYQFKYRHPNKGIKVLAHARPPSHNQRAPYAHGQAFQAQNHNYTIPALRSGLNFSFTCPECIICRLPLPVILICNSPHALQSCRLLLKPVSSHRGGRAHKHLDAPINGFIRRQELICKQMETAGSDVSGRCTRKGGEHDPVQILPSMHTRTQRQMNH